MTTSSLVEALLSGLLFYDEACRTDPDLASLRAQAECSEVPLQWLLVASGSPRACSLLRQAAQALLHLAEAIEAGQARGAEENCALWYTLANAPSWLLRPCNPDDTLPDVALLRLRDDLYEGDWEALIGSLEEADAQGWRWAIARCRILQRVERELGVSLMELLKTPGPSATPE